jgi:hypothetical protein
MKKLSPTPRNRATIYREVRLAKRVSRGSHRGCSDGLGECSGCKITSSVADIFYAYQLIPQIPALSRVTKITTVFVLFWSLVAVALAQTVAIATVADKYVNSGRMPSPARGLLFTFGDRIVRPGNERTTLKGTYSAGGAPAGATITWEVPGRMRFDRADQPSLSLIFNDVLGLINGSSLSQMDANTLETLLDDCPQTFFYLLNQGAGHRYLGGQFRADNGAAKNYAGPWYDIYDVYATARSQIGGPKRNKRYRFDSTTHLLASVEYFTTPAVRVTSEYSQWTSANGQAFPGKIIRTEGGKVVLTVNLTQATVGPSVSDGKFTGN